MLSKEMRKKLSEHNWSEIAKRDSNPHQTLRRLRDEANRAISDLALLARALPSEIQQEIFTYAHIENLLESMLLMKIIEPYRGHQEVVELERKHADISNRIDYSRRTSLASLLVRMGTNCCIQQYRARIETNSVLNEPVISQLQKSVDICREIAFKMKLPEIEKIEQRGALIYLFNWDKIEQVHETKVSEIKGEDTKKFIRFLEKLVVVPILVVNRIDVPMNMENALEFQCTEIANYHLSGFMELNSKERVVHLTLVEKEAIDKTPLEYDLVAMMEPEGDVGIYMRKNGDSIMNL